MANLDSVGKQNGASMWMLLTGASLVVLFALVAMKLIPAYLDNNKVKNALESFVNTPGAKNMSRNQAIQRISDTLYVDMASDLLDLNQSLAITKSRNAKVYSIDYERVVPMAFNISALLDFENSVEVSLE